MLTIRLLFCFFIQAAAKKARQHDNSASSGPTGEAHHYTRAEFVRTSFCLPRQAELVNKAALEVRDALDVAVERLKTLKTQVLSERAIDWRIGRYFVARNTYETFMDPGFWAPDGRLEPHEVENFERKITHLKHVISTADYMRRQMLEQRHILEITCGLDWLTSRGPEAVMGLVALRNTIENWWYDRRNSVSLDKRHIDRWRFRPDVAELKSGLSVDRYQDNPDKAVILYGNTPPLVTVISLAEDLGHTWGLGESLQEINWIRDPTSRDRLIDVIAPNLTTVLLSMFTLSRGITGLRTRFEEGRNPLYEETFDRLLEQRFPSELPWLSRDRRLEREIDLVNNRAGFIYLVMALYLNNSDWGGPTGRATRVRDLHYETVEEYNRRVGGSNT